MFSRYMDRDGLRWPYLPIRCIAWLQLLCMFSLIYWELKVIAAWIFSVINLKCCFIIKHFCCELLFQAWRFSFQAREMVCFYSAICTGQVKWKWRVNLDFTLHASVILIPVSWSRSYLGAVFCAEFSSNFCTLVQCSFEVKCLKSEDRTLFRLNLLKIRLFYIKMYNFWLSGLDLIFHAT